MGPMRQRLVHSIRQLYLSCILRQAACVLAAIGFFALFAPAASAQQDQQKIQPGERVVFGNPFGPTVAPYLTWTGAKSRVTTPSVHKVESAQEWTALWKLHGDGNSLEPEVDFEQCTVVAIFYGRSKQPGTLNILAIQQADYLGGLLMQFELAASNDDKDNNEKNSPYVMLLLPKQAERGLVLQESLARHANGGRSWHGSAKLKVGEPSTELTPRLAIAEERPSAPLRNSPPPAPPIRKGGKQ